MLGELTRINTLLSFKSTSVIESLLERDMMGLLGFFRYLMEELLGIGCVVEGCDQTPEKHNMC